MIEIYDLINDFLRDLSTIEERSISNISETFNKIKEKWFKERDLSINKKILEYNDVINVLDNLQNKFQDKRIYGMDKTNLIDTIKTLIKEMSE